MKVETTAVGIGKHPAWSTVTALVGLLAPPSLPVIGHVHIDFLYRLSQLTEITENEYLSVNHVRQAHWIGTAFEESSKRMNTSYLHFP